MNSYDKVIDELIDKHSALYEKYLREKRRRIRLEKKLRKAQSESRNPKDKKKRSHKM